MPVSRRWRLALAALAFAAPVRRAAAEPRLSAVAESQLDEGLRRLYSLDYPRARAAFHRLTELEPENPFGYLFEAGGIWWQASQEYSLFADNPPLQTLFEKDVEESRRKAEVWISSDDAATRANGYFASGMALGTLGQWRLMGRHWMDAYFDGKKAVKHLKKCLKTDASYDDAQLGLGIFDYQTAHLSGVAKLGVLLGLRGNEKRGLEAIQFAADHSRYSRRQAADFLLSIYLVDLRDFDRALPWARRLRREFPESPYFVFLEALARHHLGDDSGSLESARELYRLLAADPAAFRPKWMTLVCGLSGPQCLSGADAKAAEAWLDGALAGSDEKAPSAWRALLHLFRGNLRDVLGRREDALSDYRRVLELPDFDFAHELASACSEAPCGRDALLRRLRAFAKENAAAPSGNGTVTPTR